MCACTGFQILNQWKAWLCLLDGQAEAQEIATYDHCSWRLLSFCSKRNNRQPSAQSNWRQHAQKVWAAG